MKLEENFFKGPESEDPDSDPTEMVNNIIKEKLEQRYPGDETKVQELLEILKENFAVRTITSDIEAREDSDCPVLDVLNELLDNAYSPKPFGISWTDSDIIQFLRELGYTVVNEDSDDNCMAFIPGEGEEFEEGDLYEPEYDYKKVFNKICREKSIKLMVKLFKTLD